MKYFISILLIIFTLPSFGQTKYYFAAAGRDSTACPITNPCKTNWNTLTWAAQDSFFFNRGDTFPGRIIPAGAGTSTHPIWIGAYGTSTLAMPVIYGGYKLVGYTNVSGNIWTASCPSCRNITNLLTVNGNLQPMGRTPNSGYDTVAAIGSGYFTDPSLTGTSFSTGEAVLRVSHFTETRNIINSQSGDTIRYTAKNGTAVVGWGFFIQNNVNTLDTAGEWWYDSTTKLMHIDLPDTTVPVIVGIVDTGFYANAIPWITVDHMTFDHYNTAAWELADNTSLNFQYGKITNSNQGIEATLETNCNILYDTLFAINDYGIGISGNSNGGKINGIVMHHISANHGMMIPNSGGFGISLRGNTYELFGNNIYHIGYEPILFAGNSDSIVGNHINYSNYILDDGGNIYSSEISGTTYTGRYVAYNIADSAIGAPAGTNLGLGGQGQGVGYYADDNSQNIRFWNNSATGNSLSGFYVHDAQNISIKYNTAYGNGGLGLGAAQINFIHDNGSFLKLRNDTIVGNIFGSPSAPISYFVSLTGNDYDSLGLIDSNMYVTPISSGSWYVGSNINTVVLQTLSQWQTTVAGDLHSALYPGNYIYYSNPSLVSPLVLTLPIGSDYWKDLAGGVHFSYSLSSLSSVLLSPFRTIIPFGYIYKKLH
jgi:hypothetical protein